MTTVLIVRHGESPGNMLGEFHGQTPSDITPFGHEQAEATAVFLDRYPIDAVYSSDLPRAFSTAKHTADRRGLTVTPEKGLREIDAGKWERMKFDDIPVRYPKEHYLWYHDMANSAAPGGESVREMAKRVADTLDRIAAENDGKTIAVFTHATPIRTLEPHFAGKPLEYMNMLTWVANASVTEVIFDNRGGYRVAARGMADHLLAAFGKLTGVPANI